MAVHKKNKPAATRSFDRLTEDLPERTIATERDLFEWLYDHLNNSDHQMRIPARTKWSFDEFRREVLEEEYTAFQSFGCYFNGDCVTLKGRCGFPLFEALFALEGALIQHRGSKGAPVKLIRTVANFLMIKEDDSLHFALFYEPLTRSIISSNEFEREHKVSVQVAIPDTPEARSALQFMAEDNKHRMRSDR